MAESTEPCPACEKRIVVERNRNQSLPVAKGEQEAIMAMPQRDNAIEEIKRLDALLEYAVEHGDEAEAERIREELKRITETI